MLSPEALAVDVKDGGSVKDPVECAQQGVLLVEVLPPQGRIPVAGEDDVVSPFLVVAPVNQVKEEPGVLLVELTVANLINDETGGPHETGEHGGRFLCPAGCGELVPEL